MGAMPLFKICPKCAGTGVNNDARHVPCKACSGSAYVRFAWTKACEDHPVLDVVARVLDLQAPLRGTVSRAPDRVSFRDPDTGGRYEVVVRAIDLDEEDGR